MKTIHAIMDFRQLMIDVRSCLLPVLAALLNHLNKSSRHGEQRQYHTFQNRENLIVYTLFNDRVKSEMKCAHKTL